MVRPTLNNLLVVAAALAAVFFAAGCACLKDANGQAISLSAYDKIVIDPVSVSDEVACAPVAPALQVAIRQSLDRTGRWTPPAHVTGVQPARLEVEVLNLNTAHGDCRADAGCSITCLVTVYDFKSGGQLGSGKLTVPSVVSARKCGAVWPIRGMRRSAAWGGGCVRGIEV